MKCPNCGREILDDSNFCEFCGKPVVRSKVNKKKSYVMTFGQSVSTCFSKYATFSGRASRSEYWWWMLFTLIPNFCAGFIDGLIWGQSSVFSILVSLALLLPGLSVAVRRCHDTNHSGWWLLCPLYNLVLMLIPSDEGGNEYGILSE